MTKLTFYDDVEEVPRKQNSSRGGGSSFSRFWEAFGKEKQFYDEPYVAPREEKPLLNLRLLPRIKGLYKDEEKPQIDGVLVTHPHIDH